MPLICRVGSQAAGLMRRSKKTGMPAGTSDSIMHPRTLAIVCVILLAGSFGGRFVVKHFGLLPVSEESVLKRAVALVVSYHDQDKLKKQLIADSIQVQEV